MKKSSQIQSVGATALPEQVSVAMTEIAENMQEGLLALAVGAGLQVMQALMEAEVTTLAGLKGKHNMTRTAVRHGRECGSEVLTDPAAPYFGAVIDDGSIVPGAGATLFETRFTDWLVTNVLSDAR